MPARTDTEAPHARTHINAQTLHYTFHLTVHDTMPLGGRFDVPTDLGGDTDIEGHTYE